MTRRRQEPEWLDRALEMKANGRGATAIAKELGVSYNQVYYNLKREKWAVPEQVAADCEKCGRQFMRQPKGKATRCRSCRIGDGAPVEGKCEGCGEMFTSYPSEAKRFCSRDCWKKNFKHSEDWKLARRGHQPKRRGKGNPNFKHGKSDGPENRKLRREFNLYKKGECECRVCGSHYSMNAHHAVPRSHSTAGKYDLRNCLPLCARCHTSWHQMAITIYRDVFTAEEWAFIETLTGSPWLDKRYPDRGRPFRSGSAGEGAA